MTHLQKAGAVLDQALLDLGRATDGGDALRKALQATRLAQKLVRKGLRQGETE